MSAFTTTSLRFKALLLLGLALTFALWNINADKLGIFYDYSIIASGADRLAEGQSYYRDFTSPVQSLTLRYAWLCEQLFGARYLALAYGNLVLALALFGMVCALARKALSDWEAVFFALTVVVASTLQQGILYYDSLALVWVIAASFVAFQCIRRRRYSGPDIAILCALLFATGATKFNYLTVALVIAIFPAAVILTAEGFQRWRPLVAQTLLFICMIPAACAFEVAAGHTDLQNFLFNTIQLPAGRLHAAAGLLTNPALWLGTVYPYYVGNHVVALPAIAALLLVAIVWHLLTSGGKPNRSAYCVIAALLMFFGATIFLIITNVDVSSHSGSLFLVGLIGVIVAFNGTMTNAGRSALRASAITFSLFLFVTAGVTMVNHARLAYESSRRAPSFPVRISEGYLKGVHLSRLSYNNLKESEMLLRKYSIGGDTPEVYWGNGLEILGRVFHTRYLPGVPLWYDRGVSVRDEDSRRIASTIEQSGVRLIVMDCAVGEMPTGLISHLDSYWKRDDSLCVADEGIRYWFRERKNHP